MSAMAQEGGGGRRGGHGERLCCSHRLHGRKPRKAPLVISLTCHVNYSSGSRVSPFAGKPTCGFTHIYHWRREVQPGSKRHLGGTTELSRPNSQAHRSSSSRGSVIMWCAAARRRQNPPHGLATAPEAPPSVQLRTYRGAQPMRTGAKTPWANCQPNLDRCIRANDCFLTMFRHEPASPGQVNEETSV